MARFSMDQWLSNRGFRHGTEDQNWWSWPDGLIYFALDLLKEGQECVIHEYRDVFPPRPAIGERKEEYWDPEEPPARWTEYHFPWPKTRAEAEAIADAMGWNDTTEPPDTPLDEWIAGVDTLLNEGQES
jgi:hypothetical protein